MKSITKTLLNTLVVTLLSCWCLSSDLFAAVNPRQNMEPDGHGARTFNLFLQNNTNEPVTFTIANTSCTDSPLSTDVYGPVAPGSSITVWIARVQGNGCDGEQGTFWLLPSGYGDDRQEFTFDNRGNIFVQNIPTRYSGFLGNKHAFDGSYTYTLFSLETASRLPSPVDERLTFPRRTIAADTGVWGGGTSHVELLSFDAGPGFWPNFYDDCVGFELFHVQHVARLPNRDGRAYFIVVHSRAHNGYITLVRTYPGRLDPVTDRIIPMQDGSAVGEFIWQDVYTGSFNGNFNPVGNWNHPGKTELIGGVLMVAAQNWDSDAPCFIGLGNSEDRVLFYDVRDPENVAYWGSMTETQLGIDEIDNLGVVRVPSTGEYILGLGTGHMFRSEKMTPDFSQWKSMPEYTDNSFAGQHGMNFNSYQTVTPSPDSGLPNNKERAIFVDTPIAGVSIQEFIERKSGDTFLGFDRHSLPGFSLDLPGADRDWDADGVYITRKGVPIIYTGKSSDHSDIRLYELYDDRNSSLQVPHPDRVVTNLNDHGPGSLREAISYGGKITFGPNLGGNALHLTNGPLVFSIYDVQIDATAVPGGLVINGDTSGDDADGVFLIGEGVSVTVDSVTIRSGPDPSNTPCLVVNKGKLILLNSTVENSGVTGLFVNGGEAELTNSTFVSSALRGITEGINNRGHVHLKHCTMTTRHSEDFSSLIYSRPEFSLILENSIVAHRADAIAAGIPFPSAVFGNFSSVGANLLSSHLGKVLSGPSPIIGDPGLLPPERIGSLTDTLALLPDSLAVDNAGPSSVIRDQNGFTRVANAPGNDLGSFELQSARPLPLENPNNAPLEGLNLSWYPIPGATYEVYLDDGSGFISLGQTSATTFVVPGILIPEKTYNWRVDTFVNGRTWPGIAQTFGTRGPLLVTTLLDEDDGGIGFGEGDSLREAVKSAQPGELIRFAKFLSGGVLRLEESQIVLDKDLTIDASTLSDRMSIKAAPDSRIFDIMPGHTVTLRKLALSGGVADFGGAIRNSGSNLSVIRSSLTGNLAQESGGAIYNFNGGQLRVEVADIANNSASNGAGIFNASDSTLEVIGTWFSKNEASVSGGGGGIYHQGSSMTIERCAFTGNGGGQGGAISNLGASALIENTTLSGNGSEIGSGGGLFNRGTSGMTLRHCTVTDNVGVGVQNVPPASLTLENTIVANNFDELNASSDFVGDFNAEAANLVRVHTGSLTGGPVPLRVDPLLGPLQSGRYRSPLIGSPVLDAGVMTANTPDTDQNNQCCRPFGNGPDLGSIEAKLSADASLEWLTTNLGALSPAFHTTTYDYTVTVPESATVAAVRPARGANGQTIEVRINEGAYVAVASKAASPDMPLIQGANTIEVKVTAKNGVSFQIYTLNVQRGMPATFTTGLVGLNTSAGALSPSFHPSMTSYRTTVANGTSSAVVTATLADDSSRLEMRSGFGAFAPLTSGAASASIALNVGGNPVDIRVIGEGDVVAAAYTVHITREDVAASNAGLSSLSISAGILNPVFSQGERFYEVTVQKDVTSLNVIPTVAQAGANVRVRLNDGDFTALASGAASQALNLQAGRNLIELEVTSSNGSSVQIYSIIVIKVTDGIRWVNVPFEGFSGVNSFFSANDPSISGDGRYVAFESNAADLVPNDDNGESDIFVHDRQTDLIKRVSVSNAGEEGDFDSNKPSISADGRFVAFASEATNLVPDDRNGQNSKSRGKDIFVYDMMTDTIERVSLTESGGEGNQASDSPSISGDGRFISFSSSASNLVDGFKHNGGLNVYVRDRIEKKTIGVSIPFADINANRASMNSAISADGNYVAFELDLNRSGGNSEAYSFRDVYLFNRTTRAIERITGNKSGQDADGSQSKNVAISGDGRFVVFESNHDDIDFYDTNRQNDVFIYDRVEGTTRRVSTGLNNVDDTSKQSNNPSISGDGRYVAFQSTATNLVPTDSNDETDVFVKDMWTGETILKSVSATGVQGDGNSITPSISLDGQHVAFASRATNLGTADTNDRSDIFVTFTEPVPASNIATLAALESNLGTLDPRNVNQAYTVTEEVQSAIFRPITPEPGSTIEIQFNGGGFSQLQSDELSLELPLATGENVIELRVTAPDGSTSQSYVVTVNRSPSSNANLADLSLLTDVTIPLTPAFSTDVKSYTVDVPSTTLGVSLNPATSHESAVVNVNGVQVGSGTISELIPLNSGNNTLNITVTAEDGIATQSYSITVTRAPNNNANLARLTLGVEPLSGLLPFNPANTSYAAKYPNEVESVTLTATTAEEAAIVTVNGVPGTSGEPTPPIPLNIGNNNIVIAVGAPDGTTFKQYFVTITRELPIVASNLNLALLTTSAGALEPAFNQNITDYGVTVANDVDSATVFPVAADGNSVVQVNGTVVATGSPSTPVNLVEGANLIHILVTGVDGSNKSYTLTITREKAPDNSAANLAFLSTTAGPLSPTFSQEVTEYSVSVADDVASATVFPVVVNPASTVTVNGVAVASGTPSGLLTISPGSNLVEVVVTSEGGVTKTYKIDITKAASADFAIGIEVINGSVTISWTEPDLTLQQSLNLKDWVDVPNAVSPFAADIVASPSLFYRLRR